MQLFAWIQLKEKNIVRSGEISRAFGLSLINESKLFSRLCRRQLALRLMKGVYLMPTKIPPGGRWGPNPYWIVAQLMAVLDANYQVTGIAAFHRHGFSEQVPNQIAIYNTKLSAHRKIGGISFDFIKVASSRLGKIDKLRITEGIDIPFSSAGRSLMDAVYDWSRFGTLPSALDWIQSRSNDKILVRELIQSTATFGNIGTIRRVGYVLEESGVSRGALKPLIQSLEETKSYLPLNPLKAKKGSLNKRWGVVINEH